MYSIDPAEVAEAEAEGKKNGVKFRMESRKQIRDKEMLIVPALVIPLATRRLLTAYLKTDQARKDFAQEKENDKEKIKKNEKATKAAAFMNTMASTKPKSLFTSKSSKRFASVKVAAEAS